MKTIIIAEAGVNHNGDLEKAKQLVKAAKEAGADLVKFQTFKAASLVTKFANKAEYQQKTTGAAESQHDMVRKLELSEKDHLVLIEECRRNNIEFFSTAFDEDSFDLLLKLGINQIKVPSGELTNLPLLRHMSQFGMPLMLSTGMANLGEIEAALNVIEQAGTPRSKVTVLHCTTEYPAPMEDVNLRAMVNLGATFGVKVGYSDHTPGIEVPIAAVALGARVIEKHFTLDRNLPGPDHKASLEPHELKAMIDAIRNIEKAMGDGIKRPTPSELKNKPIARKSIVATQPINTGEVFTTRNLGVKRPGTGISPMLWDEVIGKPAKRSFAIDELIEL
ncbi:MAG: N-acetylneuraminate synthase [Limnobacter sp.]|jgi:N,N'-diacetyllegionaminate synthase|uniref:N-acetylneuraminate synthase n=1 Tax=Limnobacter sp. TaxID=2003368 RepID=UPI001217BDEE|nr:N-acetylneuraminate synthase [Limnobacter sp.]MDZ4050812.1 N-acetylneuraminate synthase [Limnobacter sp.]RZO90633.1 MAG: N-acetylneuraminate synthase [Limnobacter sp.]